MTTICLDPGHNDSGADTGAVGNGLREQDITLDIALRAQKLLVINGFNVVMTRTGAFVNGPHGTVTESLQTRCDIANKSGADLFVSIHINSGGGTGTEVFSLTSAGRGALLASKMLARLIPACGWSNRGLKTANFYVLKYTGMSAILTENGFIDTNDGKKLADPNFRQAIARAHAQAICDFYDIKYKESQDNQKQEVDIVEHAVLFFGPDDYLSALKVSQKLGNCAMYMRKPDRSFNSDCMKAEHLVVVGGPSVGHPNQTLLSGNTWGETCKAVETYL